MTINLPPSVNYSSPLVAVPSKALSSPREGEKLVACEIDWGTMGGGSNCVYVNLSNNATLEFSQIAAFSVDNSQSGSDVVFVFPDTADTLTIPAYSPKTIAEVFTNQTQFWVYSPNALSTDVTKFNILNFLPPPIAVPTTQEQETVVFNNIPAAASGNQQIIPTGTNGTIENAFIKECMVGIVGNQGTIIWDIQDGTGKVLMGGQGDSPNGSIITYVGFQGSNMNLRFQNGLKIIWTSSQLTGSSALVVNLLYRTP